MNESQLPKALIAKIEEFTSTGFMLFYTDSKNQAKHHLSINDDVSYYTLTAYADHILRSMKEMDRENYKNYLNYQISEFDEFDEGAEVEDDEDTDS